MLNEKFKTRMSALLGEEYGAFADALEKDSVRGLRVNTLKADIEKAALAFEDKLTPLSYAEDGFIFNDADGIGKPQAVRIPENAGQVQFIRIVYTQGLGRGFFAGQHRRIIHTVVNMQLQGICPGIGSFTIGCHCNSYRCFTVAPLRHTGKGGLVDISGILG